MGAIEEGMAIHQRVVKNGFSFNVVVINAMIDMYVKYRRIFWMELGHVLYI